MTHVPVCYTPECTCEFVSDAGLMRSTQEQHEAHEMGACTAPAHRSLTAWHGMSGVAQRCKAPALELEEVVQQPAARVRQVRDGVRQRRGLAPVVVDAAVQRIRHVVRRAEALQR